MRSMRAASVFLALLLASCGSGGSGSVVVSGPAASGSLFSGPYHFGTFRGDSGGGFEQFEVAWGTADADGDAGVVDLLGETNQDGVLSPLDDMIGFHVDDDRAVILAPLLPNYEITMGGITEAGDLATMATMTVFGQPQVFFFVRPSFGYTEATVAGTYHFGAMASTAAANDTAAHWGSITLDGLGGGTAQISTNAEGIVVGPIVVPITYSIDPHGRMGVVLNGVLSLEGGIGAGGELIILGGGTLAGDNPTQFVLVRQGMGFSDADLDETYFVTGLTQEVGTNVHTTVAGHLLADGAGAVGALLTANHEGDVMVLPPEALTYSVSPDGSFTITTGGGDVFNGGMSSDRRFGVFAGPENPGTDPGLLFFYR